MRNGRPKGHQSCYDERYDIIGIALFASEVSFINALCSKTTVRNVSSEPGPKGRVMVVVSEPLMNSTSIGPRSDELMMLGL